MDGAIAYSSGSRIVSGVTGLISIFFITTFLTDVEQGFYYTFGSIVALQVFFELGLSGILTQYVAHEVSVLSLNEKNEYIGDSVKLSRLASLLRFCVKWYVIVAVLVVVFLLIVGFIYFIKYSESYEIVEWRIPWVLICITTGIKLLQSPLSSILTGLGFVKDMSKVGFYQQIIIPTATWLGFILGFKLYVIGIGYLLSVLIWFLFVYRSIMISVLINLWKTTITESVSYIKEIFPYQWRIAVSWISGYFIFQLFNPVLFATEGAVIAGQMGLTLQVLSAIQVFSMSWLTTKVPMYSGLIARKEYQTLDTIFNKTLKQMVAICIVLLLSFLLLVVGLRIFNIQFAGASLGSRFLDYIPLLLMMIPVLLQQYISSWATYLRCHKKEPFLAFSVVHGVLCLLSTFIIGKMYGLYGITIGYCAITAALTPWGYYIFNNKKTDWHKD